MCVSPSMLNDRTAYIRTYSHKLIRVVFLIAISVHLLLVSYVLVDAIFYQKIADPKRWELAHGQW